MAAMARSDNFKTPECRLSYAQNLFNTRENKDDNGKVTHKYQPNLIFPKSAKADLEKKVAEVIIAQWGEKGMDRAKAGKLRLPFLAGDGPEARNKEGALNPGMGPDVFFIRPTANADRPPQVRYRDPNLQATPQEVYSGCYGKAVLNAFAWANAKGGEGVSFGIAMFQKLRDGESLGGGGPVKAEDYFETVPDSGAAPDATKSGDGAAGLFG